MKKLPVYWRIIILLFLLTAALAASTFSVDFCDFYADNIYHCICDPVSHVTGLVPFAIGEIIMYIGIICAVLSVVFVILLIFLRKKSGYKKFCKHFYKTELMALMCVVFLYMPCWFIPFRGSVFGQGDRSGLRTQYSYKEVYEVVVFAVNGINQAAEEIEIHEDGSVDFPDDEERREKIGKAMDAMKDEYPRLKGYYPPVKTALCSDVLDMMNIGGYNYPFTMEPTHNKYMDPIWMISLDAHEYSHHKGYYLENEANFLSEIALINSDDPYLRFAGYTDLYDWMISAYYDAEEEQLQALLDSGAFEGLTIPPQTDEDFEKLMAVYNTYFDPEPEVSERAQMIYDAAVEKEAEIYEMPEEVHEAITETSDKGWEVQGDILAENSYDGVTLLLLQHFDGKLYDSTENSETEKAK